MTEQEIAEIKKKESDTQFKILKKRFLSASKSIEHLWKYFQTISIFDNILEEIIC